MDRQLNLRHFVPDLVFYLVGEVVDLLHGEGGVDREMELGEDPGPAPPGLDVVEVDELGSVMLQQRVR